MERYRTLNKINIANITIKKKKNNFIYLELFYILIVFFLRDVIGLPSFITYVTDIFLLLNFLVCVGRIQSTIKNSNATIQFYIILCILIAMIFGALVNLVNPLYFLWGFRNNFRFFIFWISCVVLLNKEDIDNILKLFSTFFWLNIFVITIQYFIFNISQDNLGGLFGTASGCNAYAIILCCIELSYAVMQYFNSEINIVKLLLYCCAVFYWAALAELKILYIEVIIVIIIAVVITKPSSKSILIILATLVALVFGYSILYNLFPSHAALLLDKDLFEKYLSSNGYTNSGDLNRFTALSEIQNMFFSGNWINSLFGFGLGSCDTSNVSIFATSFFDKYEYLHYRWFTHAWVYLEQGAIGLGLLLLFIVSIFVFCFKRRNKALGKYYLTSALFVITTLIGVIYNCALEIEASYLIAFMLAIPFIISKGNYKRGA